MQYENFATYDAAMVILGAIKEAGPTETVRPAETIRGNARHGVTKVRP